jgi:hypothetical protein
VGVGKLPANILQHTHPVARARPTIHARSHPAAAQRSAVRHKPKRRKPQPAGVRNLHQASLESDDIFRTANAVIGQSAILAMSPLNSNTYDSRYRPCNVNTQHSLEKSKLRLPRLDSEDKRKEPRILPPTIHRPHLHPLSSFPSRRRICNRSRYTSHATTHPNHPS